MPAFILVSDFRILFLFLQAFFWWNISQHLFVDLLLGHIGCPRQLYLHFCTPPLTITRPEWPCDFCISSLTRPEWPCVYLHFCTSSLTRPEWPCVYVHFCTSSLTRLERPCALDVRDVKIQDLSHCINNWLTSITLAVVRKRYKVSTNQSVHRSRQPLSCASLWQRLPCSVSPVSSP